MGDKMTRFFLVLAVVLIPIHISGQVCLGEQVENPTIEPVSVTELSLFPELYLGKQVELRHSTVDSFVRTSLSSEGKVIFAGRVGQYLGGDSPIVYGPDEWEVVLVPFDMVRELIEEGELIGRASHKLTLYIGKGYKGNSIFAWVDSIKLMKEEPIEGEKYRKRTKVYRIIESKKPPTWRKQLEEGTQKWLKENEGKTLPFIQLGQPMFSRESEEKED